jgi:hypothetical protein
MNTKAVVSGLTMTNTARKVMKRYSSKVSMGHNGLEV